MYTHNNQVVMATPSGQPFRPLHVIAAQRGKSPELLRIALDTGEVILDRWSSEDDATAFLHALHLGMRGIESDVSHRDTMPLTPPAWATVANAEVVAREVEASGGSRTRAAEAYSRTLLGIGQPASIIDPNVIENCFHTALADGLNILVLAGMDDPTHASTNDPILIKSPLARLAFAAADIFTSSPNIVERIVFDAALINSGSVTNVVTIGEDGLRDVVTNIAVPRMSFSHCALNDVLFADWVGWHGNPLVSRDVDRAIDIQSGRFDPLRSTHRAIALRLAEHFANAGYTAAADRVYAQLNETCD